MHFRFAAALLVLSAAGGCSDFRNLDSADRLQAGYTMVLPGIETASYTDSNIAEGLNNGGVPTAIEVFDWTTGNPARFLEHLQDLERNRTVARAIAAKIVNYQNAYPGRPVYLIGHSGGGGMSLFALEALPPGRNITAAILLAPAVSPGYDLTEALSRTERGIWNFHSSLDSILLIAGTTVAGTIDGPHTPAAGAFGFDEPAQLTDTARQSYRRKLHQVPHHWDMARHGHLGGHFGPTWRNFSSAYLAPIICAPKDCRCRRCDVKSCDWTQSPRSVSQPSGKYRSTRSRKWRSGNTADSLEQPIRPEQSEYCRPTRRDSKSLHVPEISGSDNGPLRT